MGFIKNGANTLLLEGGPTSFASFDLSTSTPYWSIFLDTFSYLDPPSQVLLSKGFLTASEYMKFGSAVGRSNSAGTWTPLESAVQTVPEPATWTAIAIGLGLTGLIGRKRKHSDRVE